MFFQASKIRRRSFDQWFIVHQRRRILKKTFTLYEDRWMEIEHFNSLDPHLKNFQILSKCMLKWQIFIAEKHVKRIEDEKNTAADLLREQTLLSRSFSTWKLSCEKVYHGCPEWR